MTQRFDELAAQRDPLYAAMQPVGRFKEALRLDKAATKARHPTLLLAALHIELFELTVRALRNETL